MRCGTWRKPARPTARRAGRAARWRSISFMTASTAPARPTCAPCWTKPTWRASSTRSSTWRPDRRRTASGRWAPPPGRRCKGCSGSFWSPPATMFFAQLQLFMQGLSGGNVGYRLPYLSRSPLLVSAFAASVGIDTPTQSLLTIALSRTAIADAVDCLCCLCDETDAQDTILASKVLFDIDRAIDLYALGRDTNGQGGQEWRAAVLGAAIKASAKLFTNHAL